MADMSSVNAGDGVAFLVAAGIMAEITAKACSSPQTVHINAGTRAATLMQWVNIGMVEGIAFILIAAYVDKKHRKAILAGGALEAVITYGEYLYAKRAGLASGGPGTEGQQGGRGRWA
jgi:hypothetical protein